MIHERPAAEPEVDQLLGQGMACFRSRLHEYAVRTNHPFPRIRLDLRLLTTIFRRVCRLPWKVPRWERRGSGQRTGVVQCLRHGAWLANSGVCEAVTRWDDH